MSPVSILFNVVKTLFALVALSLLLLLFYLVYYLVMYMYPRFFVLGHSSDLPTFMQQYVKELIDTMAFLKEHCPAGATCPIKSFQDTIQEISGLKLQLNPGASTKPVDQRDLYIMLMHYKALLSEGGRNYKELNILKNFFRIADINQYFEDKDTCTSVDENAISPLKALGNAFKKLRENIKTEATNLSNNSTIDTLYKIYTLRLNMLINNYLEEGIDTPNLVFKDNILRSYDMRKSRGIGNFIVFKIYMQDYTEYIFSKERGTIPKIWKPFKKELKDTTNRFAEIVAGDNVQKFIQNLPYKIAGVENEGFEPLDVHENFFNLLAAIARTFISMFQIVVAIVKAISDPIRFLKLLIGYVIGLVFFVLYMLVLACGFFIFPIAAFFAIIWFKLWLTIIWTALYVIMAVVYLVLTILDFATAGGVLKLLRCENLPSDWHTRPGFAQGNMYVRSFFCSCPCYKGFVPSFIFCKRIKKTEPAFCPQQTIYNSFNAFENEKNKSPAALRGKTVYEYIPNTEYYLKMDDHQRQKLWIEVFNDKNEFLDQCSSGLSPFDNMTSSMCKHFGEINDQLEKKIASQIPLTSEEKETKSFCDKILRVCRSAYCDEQYHDGKLNYRDKFDEHGKLKYNEAFNFCKVTPQEVAQLSTPSTDKKDVLSNVLIAIVTLVIIVSIGGGIYKWFPQLKYRPRQ